LAQGTVMQQRVQPKVQHGPNLNLCPPLLPLKIYLCTDLEAAAQKLGMNTSPKTWQALCT